MTPTFVSDGQTEASGYFPSTVGNAVETSRNEGCGVVVEGGTFRDLQG
jgi:hypothetical protein